jgi:lysozyme family protein
MKNSFYKSLDEVLKYEGGYVNHPKDPGGATNRGVTQGTYDAWRASKGYRRRNVKLLTPDELTAIYKNNYWDAVRGDDLPVGIDFAVFDFAVNSGISRAVRMLQQLVGVKADGLLGPATLRAASAHQFGLTDKYCNARLTFLQHLHHWATFGRGWGRRVESVRATAKRMRKNYADLSK